MFQIMMLKIIKKWLGIGNETKTNKLNYIKNTILILLIIKILCIK